MNRRFGWTTFRFVTCTHRRGALLATVAAATTLAGGVSALPGVAVPPAAAAVPSAATGTGLTQSAASAQAQTTETPVVVTSLTTDTNQVVANPDGTFTLTAASSPVRVMQNGSWTPINTALTQNSDGSWSPAASAEQVSFSGGGSAPLVTVGSGSEQVAFAWPSPLPAPTISGSTATYPSVLPGVDLELTAFGDHYAETLVVHNAAAAANPQLQKLVFGATATGLNLATTPTGGMAATDASGNTVFSGGRPIMWDSSQAPGVGPAPTATDPGGGHVTPLNLTMPSANSAAAPTPAATTVTVNTPSSALSGTGIVYPLYIDPSINPSMGAMAVVMSSGTPYYSPSGGNLKVGYCGWPGCNNIGTARSYPEFDTSAIQATNGVKAYIYSASFQADEIWNANGCTAEPVRLFQAGNINSQTTWGGPATSDIEDLSSGLGGSSSCPAGYLTFNDSNVVSYVQGNANNGPAALAFGLIAGNESDAYDWKQFGDTSGAEPVLTVNYSFAPSAPDATTIAGVFSCGENWVTGTNTPTLEARANGNNPSPNLLDMNYAVYSPYQEVASGSNNAGSNSGTYVGWNSPALGEGAYWFWAQAGAHVGLSPEQWSAWAGAYNFRIARVAPNQPQITTFDYPPNYWGATSAAGGTFTLSAITSGIAPVAGFAYTFTGSGYEQIPNTSDCNDYTNASKGWVTATNGTATLTISPNQLSPGFHEIWVKAFDAAHNASNECHYSFYVSPTVSGEGPTRLEAENMTWTAPTGDYLYQEGTNSMWSGGYEEHFVANGAGQTFSTTFNAPVEADYAIGAELTAQDHFGSLTFSVDGTPLQNNGSTIVATAHCLSGNPSGCSPLTPPARTFYEQLGGLHLTVGTHTLTVTTAGPAGDNYPYAGSYGNPAVTIPAAGQPSPYNDNGYSAGIDYLNIIPINDVTAASFAAAMNNHGIADDIDNGGAGIVTNPPADFDFNGNTLSAADLAASGYGPGATVSVDVGDPYQSAFTMPAYNDQSGNPDNVIADGQTINLTTPTDASNIHLLVASSCGNTQYLPSIAVTVNYSGQNAPGAQNIPFPQIPDWVASSYSGNSHTTATDGGWLYDVYQSDQNQFISPAPALHYEDHVSGTTTTKTTTVPHLYHVLLPVGIPNWPIQSITLPYLGTTFTTGCPTPALHVLALTVGEQTGIVVQGPNNTLQWYEASDANPSNWTQSKINTTDGAYSDPSAVRIDNNTGTGAAVQGPNNSLDWYSQTDGATTWNESVVATSNVCSTPSVVRTADDTATAIAFEGCDHSLWWYWKTDNQTSWTSSNVAAAGTTYSTPSVAPRSNTDTVTHIAAQGPNNSLDLYWNVDGQPNWGSTAAAGPGTTYSAPSTIRISSDTATGIAVQGPNNSLVWYTNIDGKPSWIATTVGAANTTYSAPAAQAAIHDTYAQIAAQGPGNSLVWYWANDSQNTWSSSTIATSGIYGTPTVTRAAGDTQSEIAVQGSGQNLDWYDNTDGSPTWTQQTVDPTQAVYSTPSIIDTAP